MKFKDIIKGLLEGKSYTYTQKEDDVHFFITITHPINEDNECLCIVYFGDLEDEKDDWDPEVLELQRQDLEHNLWREVKSSDFYTEDELENKYR